MGFHFDLLQELADHLDMEVEVQVDNNLEEKFEELEMGDIDLIAVNLTVTKERKDKMAFTVPIMQTRQVLVQRKPENWEQMSSRGIDKELIRNQLDLAGKTVYVQKKSSHATRLQNLSDEIGEPIHIVESGKEAEQLVALVASGQIDYAVSDENVARVNQTYYPNIDVNTAVSFPQNLAWAVNKSSGALLEQINAWISDFRETTRFAVIYNKYFENHRTAKMVVSDYFTLYTGRVSAYDELIRKYSDNIGWDWRLLASMIYQESRFNPSVRSWAGAFGLMQLMPTTAARFGVSSVSSTEEQIRAGVDFIKWLDKRFSWIKDEEERKKFILASYNVGLGHVLDARRLAEKYGKDPDKWDNNVDDFILKKMQPEFYNDPVVKYGYCRGTETYNYVSDIYSRYVHYMNIIAEYQTE